MCFRQQTILSGVQSRRRSLIVAAALACMATAASASDVVVKVSNANAPKGQIGCALFENTPAFPMDNRNAKQVWLEADVNGVVCKFAGVSAGTYAVAVSHDLNGNKKVDTNFLGIPKEGWGVSNNVVPALRAPTFREAQFEVKEGADVTLEIKLTY